MRSCLLKTLINALNEYFTAFDEIIGRYGLEKLKTIGDAYMFAGGLLNLRPWHTGDAVGCWRGARDGCRCAIASLDRIKV